MHNSKLLTALVCLVTAGAQAAQISLWHLDEGSGSSTADSVGPNTGTLFNSPQWEPGIAGNAVRLSGTNQFVRVKTGAILGNAANFTIEAWVKWDGGGVPGQQMVYCEGSLNDIVNLFLNNGVPSFTVLDFASWKTVAASSPLPVGEWHHLAAVLKSGTGGIIYVDGQAVATNSAMSFAGQTPTETDLGRFVGGGGSRHFRGTIDEVKVFNHVRTTAEILADYQQFTTTDLAVTKTVAPGTVFVGSNLTYTIVVTNPGPANAASVVLTDALPASVTFDSAITSQGTCTNQGGVVTASLGTVTNATAAVITITVTANSTGQITNTCSVSTISVDTNSINDTAAAIATANAATPSITTQPTDQSASNGGTATFGAQAAGAPPLTYQWQLNGTNISGATGATLLISNATFADAGLYTVVVSNGVGSVTSSNAVLTVLGLQLYAVVTLGGPVGSTYSIQYVTDITDTNWITLTNVTLPVSPYFHIDFGSPGAVRRFYRAILLP